MTTEMLETKRQKKSRKLRRLAIFVACALALFTMLAISTFADEAVPVVALEAAGMGDLVTQIFESFSTVIEGLADGLKTAFTSLIYTDSTASTFSPLILFIFTLAGVGLAAGILYKIFGLIQARRRG